jgi:hypothetical protein
MKAPAAMPAVTRRLKLCVIALAISVLPATALAQDTHLLVVTGVANDAEYGKMFHGWATKLIDAARSRGAVPDANVTYLGEKTELDPARIRDRPTKDIVEKTVTDLGRRAKPNDQVFIVLIGHGSFDGREGKFNLPGPDMTTTEWAKLVQKLARQRVIFVNTSSSSGAFLAPLAGPGRTVVTATKTGGERNETRFGGFFVEAFADESADRDRNGRVSVLEAFDYAKTKVVNAYEQEGLLLSEHAALDDSTDGKLATTVFLGSGSSASALKVDTSDPEMRGLVAERDAIDKQIAELKLAKDGMPADRYEQTLERLLTELALKTRAIRDLQAKKDGKS